LIQRDQLLGVEIQSHVAIELALVGPAFVDLHVDEQVDPAVEEFDQFLVRLLADPFQGLAARRPAYMEMSMGSWLVGEGPGSRGARLGVVLASFISAFPTASEP
jgi:hypothetical protein